MIRTLILIAVAIAIVGCKKDVKPNIIIFFTDDQGYGDAGVYGANHLKTPGFDSLAASGMLFTDFYVPATVCTPSRAGLLTGRYPIRAGLHEAVLFPFSDNGLDTTEFTMAEYLKTKDYSTSIIGKWHLGHKQEYMPLNHGFDYFYGVPYSNDMDGHYYGRIEFQSPPLPFYENDSLIDQGPDQRFLTRRYTEKAVEIIENTDEPFFIYLAHSMPHLPLHPSPEFVGTSEHGIYGDVIEELDWSMRKIVEALEEKGIRDNTLFIFTSDNGPAQRANAGSPGSLNGWKASTWDGGQRVPFIASWPNTIPAGTIHNGYGSTMDIFPTLMKILGDNPGNYILDGRSIQDILEEPTTTLPDQPFIYYARDGKPEAIRMGDWKLRFSNFTEGAPADTSLYHLRNDIGEQENVYESNKEVAENLLNLFIQETGILQTEKPLL